jgi:ketosteroid isomerase-like protein
VSDADVEFVRRSMEKWLRNDRDAAMADWAEDATMNAPKEWPEPAASTNRQEVRAVFDGFDDAFGPEWPTQLTVDAVRDVGAGRILVEFGWKTSGVSSGVELFQEIAGIYTVTNGKISHGDFFTSHEQGRRAAGLE